MALRQRPPSYWPRCGIRCPLRRFLPVHANGRPRRPHGLRHRRAWNPDPGGRRRRRHERPRTRRPEQPTDRRRPRGARPVLRPLHPHDRRQPLPRRPGHVRHRARQRLHDRAGHARRHLPVHRPHPARPLHRRHVSDLRRRGRARRPVRQLRQPDGPDRAHQPALAHQRRNPQLRGVHPLLPRPARPGRGPVRLARRAREVRHLASQRHQVLPELPRGHPSPRHDARHRLGHPGPRLGGPAHQAPLRVVRRRHRLPERLHRVGAPHRRPRGVAQVVERPRGPDLLLHGQGQHRLPLADLARRDARLQRPGREGWHPR